MYEDLLPATCEAETEYTESKVSARVKGANVKECKDEGTTELKDKIDSLTPILMSSSFGTNKPQGGGKMEPAKPVKKGGHGKSKSTPNTLLKGKGPGTVAAGLFKGNQKPIQCYNYGGWAHGRRECPSKGNFNWRELRGAQTRLATVTAQN